MNAARLFVECLEREGVRFVFGLPGEENLDLLEALADSSIQCVSVRDEDDAVRQANGSPFGLGAAVFTADLQRGERIAARLGAGCCVVNASVRSAPRLSFGGVKQSGYGRELSRFGIREFVNVKTVCVA